MKNDNSNHSAFPSEFQGAEKDFTGMPVLAHRKYYGLTKREYLASQAMKGLLAQHIKLNNPDSDDEYLMEPLYKANYVAGDSHDHEELCRDAIAIADELLKQLESKHP